eukprot:2722685-Pyramimonas_sp.AAC.1
MVMGCSSLDIVASVGFRLGAWSDVAVSLRIHIGVFGLCAAYGHAVGGRSQEPAQSGTALYRGKLLCA